MVSVLQGLAAGDTVTFQAGTHTVSGRCGFTLPGTVSAPITIQGTHKKFSTYLYKKRCWICYYQ